MRRPRPAALLAAVCAPLALGGLAAARPAAAQAERSAAPAAGAPVAVDWAVLAGLDVQSGRMTDALRRANGQVVRIPGFVVPLDDAQEEGAEFLLVPYYGACVHTPPPPPNQLVLVRMQDDRSVKLGLFEPVWLEGTLAVRTVESAYGAAGFEVRGLRVAPYKK